MLQCVKDQAPSHLFDGPLVPWRAVFLLQGRDMTKINRAAARADALRVALHCAGLSFPKSIRSGFIRSGTERLREHFGPDGQALSSRRFSEAVVLIDRLIVEMRERLERLALAMPHANHGELPGSRIAGEPHDVR